MAGVYLPGQWRSSFKTCWCIFIFYASLGYNLQIFGQCQDTADFNNWFEGHHYQNWEVINKTQVWDFEEIFPVTPTFFVSNKAFINVRFSFDVVSNNNADNDFIGFVLGYKSPLNTGSTDYEMILFDWKAETETAFGKSASEGFNLSAFHGIITESTIHHYFWGHNGVYPNAIFTPIAYSYGGNKGWVTGKSYHFEVLYTTGSIEIYLDGSILFDISRCNQPGRVGFYAYSQHDVIFSNFNWQPATDAFVFPGKICLGDTIFYTLEDTLCGGYNPLIQSWRWIFGDGDSISNTLNGHHIYTSAGDYSVQLIAEFSGGCLDTVTTKVKVQPPLAVDLGPDTTLPPHSSITLTAGPDIVGYNYLWSTGSILNQLTLSDLERDTIVNVMVSYGLCQTYDEILISIEEELPDTLEVFIPNAFSPNGDGVNDVFLPFFSDEIRENYLMYIYDRWGTEIFRSNNCKVGWDGSYNGKTCPAEVYVVLIFYQSAGQQQSGNLITKKGNIILVK